MLRADNPLTVPSLTWHQRLSYASTLLGWFDAWRTLGFVLLPIATLLTGGLPAAAPATTFLTLFGISWLIQRLATQVLARGRAPLWPATIFEFVRMPASLKATTAIVSARPRPFAVTDKGRTGEDRRRMPIPRLFIALIAGCIGSALWYVATITGHTPLSYPVPWVAHASAVWLAYNAAFLGAALYRIRSHRFAGERRAAARFPASGRIRIRGREAEVLNLSLTGMQITTEAYLRPGSTVRVNLDPVLPKLVEATVRSSRPTGGGFRVGDGVLRLDDARAGAPGSGAFPDGIGPGARIGLTDRGH